MKNEYEGRSPAPFKVALKQARLEIAATRESNAKLIANTSAVICQRDALLEALKNVLRDFEEIYPSSNIRRTHPRIASHVSAARQIITEIETA